VKNKLIKDVLPKYWETDEWLVYWVNFYSSFIAISGGVDNHLTVVNRELPQQRSLARGEELGQPHKKPYQRWYRLLCA
jgi:hypothetical protein